MDAMRDVLHFINASSEVINKYVIPTPLYELDYQNWRISETYGFGTFNYTINAVDFLYISTFFNIPILWVGETGAGKTLLSRIFASTILPPKYYKAKRLSSGLGENTITDLFYKIEWVDGQLKRKVLEDELKRTGVIFIDEVNRARDDEILQLLDGYVTIDNKHYKLGPNRKPVVIGAMNPSGDMGGVKYTGTKPLDAAIKSRWLTVEFPNIGPAAGASISMVPEPNYSQLFHEFLEKFEEYSGKKFATEEDWVRYFVELTSLPIASRKVYQSFELGNLIFALTSSHDWEKMSEIERKLLSSEGYPLPPPLEITTEDEEMLNVLREVELGPRDIRYVDRLARGLSLLRWIKSSSNDVAKFEKHIENGFVLPQDVFFAYVIRIKNKVHPAGRETIHKLIKGICNSYLRIEERIRKAVNATTHSLGKRGIKNLLIDIAALDSEPLKNVVQYVYDTIPRNKLEELIVLKIASDLMVLNKFMQVYGIKLKNFVDLRKEVHAKLVVESERAGASFPVIFDQRIPQIIGMEGIRK